MNDEVKIDNSFKLSFMTDVAKGMEYLHKSHLHSHGNLKSSNCLVDGRWTVRVSSTNLPRLFTGDSSRGKSSADHAIFTQLSLNKL